jgi:hypothetical protein
MGLLYLHKLKSEATKVIFRFGSAMSNFRNILFLRKVAKPQKKRAINTCAQVQQTRENIK